MTLIHQLIHLDLKSSPDPTSMFKPVNSSIYIGHLNSRESHSVNLQLFSLVGSRLGTPVGHKSPDTLFFPRLFWSLSVP